VDVTRYLRALKRWVWLLVLCPLVAVVGAGLVTKVMPPVYEAQASVLVKPAQPLAATDPTMVAVSAEQISSTYAQLMTERPILQQVVNDLRLRMSVDDLGSKVKVAPQSNTSIITVSVDSTSRKLARDVANGLVNDFIAQTKHIQQQQSQQYTARIQAQIQQVQQSIASDQASIDKLGRNPNAQQQNELASLQQQLSADRTQYSVLVGNLANLEAQDARSTDNLVVISPAVLPDRAVSPRPWLNLLLALVGGLTLAVGSVLGLERLDQSVKSDEQLIERTGLVAIGHIPYVVTAKGGREDLVALADGLSPVAEAYKALRTNLLFSSLDKRLQAIVVTSSVPMEGKSRTAANLAVVLAQAGYSTVLVDADFRRPSQHRIFGRIRNVGLSNLMLRDVPEQELLWPVERVPNLHLIASGPTPPNPSELLGSAQMRALLGSLRERFTYVIVDTPPVNAVTDPTVLAAHADATILVIEQGRTTFPALTRAKQALERVDANIAGAVINKLRSESTSYYYYNYQYGNYHRGNGKSPEQPVESMPGGRAG
jgi:non-specific protein-tyrosine kinase